MARMIPALTEQQLDRLPSQAEATFYKVSRDQLPATVAVFHSIGLIRLNAANVPHDGEADFTIVDPDRGVMVVEVKGGGIEFEPISGIWKSNGRKGSYEIKDPFAQARGNKYGLISYLNGDQKWKQLGLGRVLMGHAVCFPDVNVTRALRMPQAPQEIIAGRSDLADLAQWLAAAFEYWRGNETRNEAPGTAGLAHLESLLAPRVRVQSVLAHDLDHEELVRIQLTEQQARLLRALGRRRRAVVCGGAGTGKTLLAISRARELAKIGHRTLLLCYNAPLGDYLKASAEGTENLDVMTFHQLCQWRANVIRSNTGRDLRAEAANAFPKANLFDVLLPYVLAASTEISDFRYDAIVVDEAQDFRDDYWLGIELLLRRDESWLYVFFDHNQSLYRDASSLPISEPPFVLTANCRNTRFIHEAAYRFYSGEPTDPPSIEGAPLDVLVTADPDEQARRISRDITRLIINEGVAPTEIAVLHLAGDARRFYGAMQRHPLPAGARWAVETHRTKDGVVLDTVARFKGLEASVIYLCGLEHVEMDSDRELIYVGLSRAKGRVTLVGSDNAISRLSATTVRES